MCRGRNRRRNAGLASLCGIAGRRRVKRMVVGQLRAQQVPLHRQNTLCLLYLTLGNRTGMRQRPAHIALRHVKKYERQQH